MANKLVAVRIKQQNGQYSDEIPVGAWADNVAYNTTTTVKQQLDSLLQRYQDISVDVADAVDNWINQNLPNWDPTQDPLLLDDTLTSQDRPPISAAVQELIAINEETPINGAKLKIDTYNLTTEESLEDLEVLTPTDIDDTLSVEGMVADAKTTGDAIKNIAAEFDNTQSYKVGDYCIKDNILYVAIIATAANEGWITSRWQQRTIINAMETEAAYKDMIAQTQTAMTATKAYTAGEYICVNKKLYRTITVITNGSALTVGTNVEEIKLVETITDTVTAIDTINDQVGELKAQIINIGIEDAFVPTIYIGQGLSISASTPGKVVQNSKNACTSILAGQHKRYALTFANDIYEYRLFSFDENGNVSIGNALEYTDYTSGNSIIPDIAQKIALSFRRKDLEDMTEEDGENIQAALKFYKPTGSTLRSEINKSIGAEEITGWKTKTRIRTDRNTVDFNEESTIYQFACIVVDCTEGEQFTLTGYIDSNQKYRLVCWCQLDGTVLSRVDNHTFYQDQIITAPAGAEKLVVNTQYTFNPPTSYYIFRGVTPLAKENTLQEEVDEANKGVEILFSKDDVEITGYTLTAEKYVYYKNGTLKSSSLSSATSLIDVSKFGSVKFKRQGSTLAQPDSGAAFYDANGVFIPGSGIRAAGGRAQTGYLPDLYTAVVPENAKYARFTVYSNEEIYGTFEVYGVTEMQSVMNDIKEIKAYPIGLHTAPENQGVINAILRARQMTDIKWTPAFDLARALIYTRDGYHWEYTVASNSMVYRGKYAEGKEYRGLPYNEPDGVYNILGICTPIEAFVTACESDRSVEALESSYSSQGYGASYYACTCTILTCYALGLPYTYAKNYGSIDDMNQIGVTITNGMTHEFTERLKLCDILQIDGHCALITDIIRDNGGDVTLIEVSEQTRQGNPNPGETDGPFGALCRRITLPVDKFTQMFDGFTVMRYANLSKVDYFPCLYSPVGDEGNLYAPAFHPVLPYMGNKSTHAAGNVKLLIQTEGFSTLIVKKDREAFATLDVTGLDEVTVNCPDEGKYTAYLASFNESNEITKGTISCEWYVRPGVAPTWSIENGVITFSYITRGEYKPYMAIFNANTTYNGNYKMIFPEDCTEMENQDGTYTVTCSLSIKSTTNKCLFFARSPEYGVAAYSFNIEQ